VKAAPKGAAPGVAPAAKAPAAPSPATAPAAPAKPIDDDEDAAGGYGLAAAPEIAPMPDVLKTKAKKDKAPARHRLLQKQQVQYGEEWQDVRLPFMLFVVGLGMWILVWIIQAVILVLAFIAENNYGVLADPNKNVLYSLKGGYTVGEYESVDRVSFAIAVLVGDNQKGLGKGLYITCEVLDLLRHIVWIVAYVLCLKLPDVFNSRGQIIALLSVGGFNLLISLILKLLPLVGAMKFAQLPFVIPELPLATANQDRLVPLQAFWSWSPF